MATNLPEGTDTIIEDVEATAPDTDFDHGIPMSDDAAEEQEKDLGEAAAGQGGTRSGGGAGAQARAEDVAAGARDAFKDAAGKAGDKAADLKGQATEKLRAFAETGKGRASETLSGVAKMVEDAAATVDEKVGGQYGDYARQAAQTLSGFAAKIDEQDVDALFEQGRDVIRKSPALAIGAAAAIGFVIARVVKSGIDAAAAGAAEPRDETKA